MKKPHHRKRADEHLPLPGLFRRTLDPHKRLDRFFEGTEDLHPLEILKKLNEKFGIGGAPPYITVRAADRDHRETIVVRNTEPKEEVSVGIPATGLSEAQIKAHPAAYLELVKYADEKLLRLQGKNAPGTLRYSRILRWWLERQTPATADEETERKRRETNRERDVRDPVDVFRRHARHVVKLVEFFRDRRLESHSKLVGHQFAKWFRDLLRMKKAPTVGNQPQGGQDGTISGYHDRLAQALNTFVEETQAPVKVSFDRIYASPRIEQRHATGFTAPEVIRLILFCLGFLWHVDGFAWEWAERNGRPHKKLIRLQGDELEAHLRFFEPALLTILIYVMTGTRLSRIASLGYEPHDYRGWIDFAKRMIIRNGRKGPNYRNKPRRPSRILPFTIRILHYFHARDQRRREREQWDDLEKGGFHVVHDGRGGKVDNLVTRMNKAYEAVGVDHTRHDLKVACVGLFWEAGFDLRRIARLTGNDPGVCEESYLFLQEESEGIERPRPEVAKMTFLSFVDPKRELRRAPRASRPGLPPPKPKKVAPEADA